MDRIKQIQRIKNRIKELTFGPDELFDVDEIDKLVQELEQLERLPGDSLRIVKLFGKA